MPRTIAQRPYHLQRVLVGGEAPELALVVGDDAGADDVELASGGNRLLREAAEQLVEMPVVVRAELGDDFVQLFEKRLLVDPEAGAYHRLRRLPAGVGGEVGGRVQRVVDVEEQRLERFLWQNSGSFVNIPVKTVQPCILWLLTAQCKGKG